MMSQSEMTWTSGLIPIIEPEIVSEIISRIADLALVISSSGTVLGVLSNPNSKLKYAFSRWEGQPLSAYLTVESIPKFEERLAAFVASGGAAVRPVELNHTATREQHEFPVRYSFHRIGTDGAILLLGQDLRPVAEMQQQLVAAQIALEKDYEAQREYDTRLRVLMGAMHEGTLFVSAGTGEITDCNPFAVSLLGVSRGDVMGRALPELVSLGDGANLLDALSRVASAQTGNDVRVKTAGGRELSLRPTLFRATGEQMLLCQMVDAEGISVRSDGLEEHLSELFDRGADGIVFINKSGSVLSANEAFMRLTDVVHTEAVKGRTITDFLGRGSVDLNVICENATRTGAMRLYATRMIGEHGVEIPVEIATTFLNNAQEPVFAMVIRDASRAEMVRKSNKQITDVDMRSVIELIGSQTLKGIVAKTTDVIEKMCIETAVELTSNNRVAAAEMLGLSRQSLYVKLRKYDLLKKEHDE
ncbi:transcriptional regulator PpsR [Sulfitobacter sp. JBTF-M27]|uniref:Transcriptional regulator PpsR n=2 Tax=Sulfitobacter sediminilitoris TaxID=2698830 RepID=A0A6P0CFK7_9RHOB|nr:transcriptional regulator PpsR [Sulfitobacter sediminilitoris]